MLLLLVADRGARSEASLARVNRDRRSGVPLGRCSCSLQGPGVSDSSFLLDLRPCLLLMLLLAQSVLRGLFQNQKRLETKFNASRRHLADASLALTLVGDVVVVVIECWSLPVSGVSGAPSILGCGRVGC